MAFGTRYSTKIKNHTGDIFGINIEKKNYSGDSTHISRGGNISIDWKGGRENLLDAIYPSLCRFELWAEEKYPNGNTGKEEFQELLESQYKDFRVTITKNGNSLADISDGQNIFTGVDWNITGGTVLLSNQDSKDLALEFEDGQVGIEYRINYNFDVTTNVSATTMQSVIDWTTYGPYTGVSSNAAWRRGFYNSRWQSSYFQAPGHSNRLKGLLYYAAPNVDYSFVFKLGIANNIWSFSYTNNFIFRLWAVDDTIIDTVVQSYTSQGFKTANVTFNSNSKVPGYVTVEVEHNVGNGGYLFGSTSPGYGGDYWLMDAGTTLVGSSGSTKGNFTIKMLDENFNVLDFDKVYPPFQIVFNSWIENGNRTGSVRLKSTTVPPKYISVEAEHTIGDQTLIKLNEISVQSDANDNVYWRGWVQPDLIATRFLPDGFLISLDCTDGLTDLKEIPYPESGTTSSFVKIIEAVKNCLSGTDIPLPIASQINLSNDEIGTNPVASLYISGSRFKDIRNGKIEYVKKYKGLEMILKAFNAHIKQQDGYWQVTQRNELESNNYIFDWDLLTDVGQEVRDREIDVNDEQIVFESDELSKIAPLRYAIATINNFYTGDNYIFNGDFSQGLTGWANSTGATAFYAFTQDNTTNAVSVKNIGFLKNPNVDCYFDYNIPFAFGPVTTGDTIIFSVDVKGYAEVTGTTVVFNPHYRIEFLNADTGIQVPYMYAATDYIYPGGWRNYSHRYKVEFDGNLKLRVWVMSTQSSSHLNFSLTDVSFDNFHLAIQYKNTNAFSLYREVTNVSTTAIESYETTQYFTDTFTPLEKASLKFIATGATSATWSNADLSVTGHNITDLYLNEVMTQYSEFKDFVSMNIRSLAHDLQFDSVLTIYNKKYYIAQLSKNLMQNLYDVQLVERLEASPQLVFSNGSFDTGTNSSTGGGSGSGGGGTVIEPVIYYPGQNITIVDNVISAIIPPIAISGISLSDYTLKTDFNTYSGTTVPSTYVRKSLFNIYSGATNTRLSTIESNYVTGSTNGLTKSGKRLQLGGTLNNSTTLQGNSGTISFNFGGSTSNPNRLQTFRVFAHDEINFQLSGTQFWRFTTGYTQLYIPDQGIGRGLLYFNDQNHLKRLETTNNHEGKVLTVSNFLPAYTGITYLDHYRRQRQKTVSTNSYNVRPHDNNYVVYCTHTGTTTIKLGSSIDSGTTVCFVRMGGPVVFSATGASTYDGYSNTIYVQKGSAVVTKKTSVQWFGSGALASGGTGGGSLTGFTVSNGLTLSGNNIKLGGELTENTSITKGSQDFNFTDDGIIINCEEFFIDSVEGSSITSDEFVTVGQQLGIGTTELYLRGGKFELAFRSVTAGGGLRALFTDNRTGSTKVGIEYAADYSANFATNSLVTKKYVYGLSGITNNNISIDFVNNRIRFLNVPTSSAGLPSGTIWKDGSGFLKIV